METTSHTPDARSSEAARLALFGFIAVGAFIGYEWLMSGLTKLVRGGFPAGLADELREKSEGTVGWYKSFLDGTVIPNGRAFGVLIELAELAIGITLIGAAIVIVLRWDRLGYRAALTVLAAVALASIGAIVMNVAFHLANTSPHPWLIPEDGFDEGVDLDSLLPLIQLAFVIVATRLLFMLRRDHRAAADRPPAPARSASPTR